MLITLADTLNSLTKSVQDLQQQQQQKKKQQNFKFHLCIFLSFIASFHNIH